MGHLLACLLVLASEHFAFRRNEAEEELAVCLIKPDHIQTFGLHFLNAPRKLSRPGFKVVVELGAVHVEK